MFNGRGRSYMLALSGGVGNNIDDHAVLKENIRL